MSFVIEKTDLEKIIQCLWDYSSFCYDEGFHKEGDKVHDFVEELKHKFSISEF